VDRRPAALGVRGTTRAQPDGEPVTRAGANLAAGANAAAHGRPDGTADGRAHVIAHAIAHRQSDANTD